MRRTGDSPLGITVFKDGWRKRQPQSKVSRAVREAGHREAQPPAERREECGGHRKGEFQEESQVLPREVKSG